MNMVFLNIGMNVRDTLGMKDRLPSYRFRGVESAWLRVSEVTAAAYENGIADGENSSFQIRSICVCIFQW